MEHPGSKIQAVHGLSVIWEKHLSKGKKVLGRAKITHPSFIFDHGQIFSLTDCGSSIKMSESIMETGNYHLLSIMPLACITNNCSDTLWMLTS